MISIYKGKGDVRSYRNYRIIKLLEHAMKVIERIFEKSLQKVVEQMGFLPGRSPVMAIHMW